MQPSRTDRSSYLQLASARSLRAAFTGLQTHTARAVLVPAELYAHNLPIRANLLGHLLPLKEPGIAWPSYHHHSRPSSLSQTQLDASRLSHHPHHPHHAHPPHPPRHQKHHVPQARSCRHLGHSPAMLLLYTKHPTSQAFVAWPLWYGIVALHYPVYITCTLQPLVEPTARHYISLIIRRQNKRLGAPTFPTPVWLH